MPRPSSARATISQPRPGASAPPNPEIMTRTKPATVTLRGPYSSAIRPIAGWPTAAARYSEATSQAVELGPT